MMISKSKMSWNMEQPSSQVRSHYIALALLIDQLVKYLWCAERKFMMNLTYDLICDIWTAWESIVSFCDFSSFSDKDCNAILIQLFNCHHIFDFHSLENWSKLLSKLWDDADSFRFIELLFYHSSWSFAAACWRSSYFCYYRVISDIALSIF